MKPELNFRKPSAEEAELINRLLSADFIGKKELNGQLDNYQVRTIDEEGSIEIRPNTFSDSSPVIRRIPVEADGVDEDGIHIHILLHVVDGFVKEMEIYKDDGSPIRRMPDPGTLEMIVLPA